MLLNLVSVGVYKVRIELHILALHDPSWTSLESIHSAAFSTLLQVI